jgi:tellurite methyltransferase
MTDASFVDGWIARLSIEARAAKVELGASRQDVACALDVAMGRGRHTLRLARAGFRTFGVDIRYDAVHDAAIAAASGGHVLRVWCADLTQHPLPRSRFDLVVVTRYLQRDLFGALRAALRPGGTLLYETFTAAQRAHGRGPTSPDHLLEPGELARAFPDLETLYYEEVSQPDAVARLAARRR